MPLRGSIWGLGETPPFWSVLDSRRRLFTSLCPPCRSCFGDFAPAKAVSIAASTAPGRSTTLKHRPLINAAISAGTRTGACDRVRVRDGVRLGLGRDLSSLDCAPGLVLGLGLKLAPGIRVGVRLKVRVMVRVSRSLRRMAHRGSW